jgi:predicted CXXCH cytochrome family protein
MTKLLVALFLAGAGALLSVAVASADNGFHGNYTATTTACASCHRAHTAQAAHILRADGLALCLTCHGSGTSMDVINGVKLGAGAGALKGGGFVYARINTGDPLGGGTTTTTSPGAATSTGYPVTSAHIRSTSGLINNNLVPNNLMWGNGAANQAGGKNIANTPLQCIDCHNPHGNNSYRILRARPFQSDAVGDVSLADDAPGTQFYTTANYWQTYQGSAGGWSGGTSPAPTWKPTDMSNWCLQCHTRYVSQSASTAYTDPVFTYRHASDGSRDTGSIVPSPKNPTYSGTFTAFCLQCHVAHGSPAFISGGLDEGQQPMPGQNTGRGSNSTLLKIDHRGTCVACHGLTPGS